MHRLLGALAALLMLATGAVATEAGWALLRNGGQVVLLVHANAPGTGDPANFELGNCRTQRNLSERGIQQARRTGALFAARAAPVDRVLASRWCRTLDTARQAFPRIELEEMAALDPVVAGDEQAAVALGEVLALIRDLSTNGNVVLVTHPETATALTGQRAREGEALIVQPIDGGLHVAARIAFN